MSDYKWNVLSSNMPQNAHEVISILLKNRNITDEKEFLNPLHLADMPSPLKSKDLKRACGIIRDTIKKDNPIIIHGDYDADGQCATAILWRAIRKHLGYKRVLPYIPNRFDEGYGLSHQSLQSAYGKIKDNPKRIIPGGTEGPLLITVDCGIISVKEVAEAKRMGFKTIITDHHEPGAQMPDADAILHTTKATGAGIAWLLANELLGEGRAELAPGSSEASGLLGLAAIGTIADLQPLTGFNRSIAKHGLGELNKNPVAGIRAIIDSASIKPPIGTYEIGWQIGPRLNATGRLEDAMESLKLLCTDNLPAARQIAARLNEVNQTRQNKTQKDLEYALALFEKENKDNLPPILVTAHAEYHEGIIGLVAGKLVQKYNRVAIVISIDKKAGVAKGSARSIKGISIIDTLRKFEDLFEGLGGHEQAAGFSIKHNKLDELTSKLVALDEWDKSIFTKTLPIDCELPTSLINKKTYIQIEKLKPFGMGNPEPLFLTKGLEIFNMQLFGKENAHLKLFLKDSRGKNFTAMAFNKGDIFKNLRFGQKVNIAHSLTLNTWNGNESLELRARDFTY